MLHFVGRTDYRTVYRTFEVFFPAALLCPITLLVVGFSLSQITGSTLGPRKNQ